VKLRGNVTAKNVTVGGKVRGTISATEKIVFEGKSVSEAILELRVLLLTKDRSLMAEFL